ncbi:Glucose-6-phosphate 1-dehydrogenase [Pestalotiopsis sp. IQ-011]
MASHDYNRHPLPAPPSQSQQDQQQYSYPSSYNNNNNNQQPSTSQQYQSRPQQSSRQPPTHPPVTQQPQQRPERRPRSRGFSFRSDKSKPDQASGHARKLSGGALHETHAEKEAKRLNTKADPTLAMQEAEPSAVARDAINWEEKPPLSSIQHKDSTGNPIAEPDRSNPTRSKWERPLDTIRSFEAAFDDGYSSRQSVYRTDSDSQSTWNNRRSSYYGNSNGPRFPHEGYYGGGRSGSSQRPESVNFDPRASAMAGGPRDAYFDGFDSGNGGPHGGNGPRNRISRQQPEPYLTSHPVANRNVYPSPNDQRSYETVASGSGSASYGEHSGYQTDPTSSENSSINRRSPHKRQQEAQNDYGISFGQTPGYRPPVLGEAASQPRTMPDNSHAPPPPPKTGGPLLRKSSKAAVATEAPRSESGDKRKSWFSRRFNKNA